MKHFNDNLRDKFRKLDFYLWYYDIEILLIAIIIVTSILTLILGGIV
jgi:hypothetical protein